MSLRKRPKGFASLQKISESAKIRRKWLSRSQQARHPVDVGLTLLSSPSYWRASQMTKRGTRAHCPAKFDPMFRVFRLARLHLLE
jgi:hypothetical protein